MAQNFVACDRDQELLLPPSLRDWLPEGHLAWFVIDAVAQVDLTAFYAAYRVDGHGRPAHDPAMMVALLLYGYAIGERSSRRLERRCIEDVATRVICANRAPDHTTIARFRQRHEAALGELFGEVLALCAQAGLVRVGVVAVDGTKVAANAAPQATRDYEQIAREILAEADAVDAEEDARFGEALGDELPPELSTAQGRRGWLREAKRRLDEKRAEEARPIPRDRPGRLREAKRRLEEEHRTECRANAAYEAYRARGRMKDGRRFGRPPDPFRPPPAPTGKINLSDLDSRNVKTSRGWVQGYNAQAACTEDQIVIAAELTVDSPDFGHLQPMIRAAQRELRAAGVDQPPGVVLADAGYWHQAQMERLVSDGMKVLIPPDAKKRSGARPGWEGGPYAFMRRVLETDTGGQLYAKRQTMIEPIFADTKFNRRIDRFLRRGRSAARSEWRLANAAHNLLKLWRHTNAPAAA
ncbi:MAG TPA: transposase [Allosphingosinicella sp.]|jgi:transposase|nr:transposase [Allosphingosinicella sp.]